MSSSGTHEGFLINGVSKTWCLSSTPFAFRLSFTDPGPLGLVHVHPKVLHNCPFLQRKMSSVGTTAGSEQQHPCQLPLFFVSKFNSEVLVSETQYSKVTKCIGNGCWNTTAELIIGWPWASYLSPLHLRFHRSKYYIKPNYLSHWLSHRWLVQQWSSMTLRGHKPLVIFLIAQNVYQSRQTENE